MEQRRLRLGDILDDYCPRERRITNHAVVAMIEDQVRQTRCTTCDADHPYKGGKAPAPRRKKEAGALAADPVEHAKLRVLGGHGEQDADDDAIPSEPFDSPLVITAADSEPATTPAVEASADASEAEHDGQVDEGREEDEWPVHRRLIRATLPRTEGQTPERKEPDFTMHRPVGRGIDGNRGGHRHRNGHRPMRHAQGQGHSGGQPTRFGGPRQGGQGQRQGPGPGGQPQGNRPARHGGQSRGGQHPGGGPGRKRGR